MNASDKFAIEWTDTQIDVEQFKAHVRRRVLSMLRVLEDDLTAQIVRMDLTGVASDASRRARAERLIREVQSTVARRFDRAEQRLRSELRDLSVLSQQTAVRITNKVFTVNIMKPALNIPDLKALSDRSLILGGPQKEWWAEKSEGLRRRFAREVRKGALNGETNDQIIQRIRGKRTGRRLNIELANGKTRTVSEYSGGVMKTSRREAETLVRTSIQNIHNASLFESYQGMEEVLRGYEAITTLDGRTSEICMARTGASWDLEGNPLPESSIQEPFPGHPPWHHNCRTVLGPLTKTWEQMVEESSGQRLKLLNTVPDSERASFDGLMGQVGSFDDVLKAKGDPWARQKLGAGKFDLWKQGKITTSQLIDQTGRPRTLSDIRESLGLN